MTVRIYNLCMLVGWLMVTGGIALEKGVGVGIACGGTLLLVLTLVSGYLAGGGQQPRVNPQAEQDNF